MYIKGRELGELVDDYGSMQEARDSLLQLVQAASSLSFALRAPSYNDVEIEQLHKHAQDMVSPRRLFVLLAYIDVYTSSNQCGVAAILILYCLYYIPMWDEHLLHNVRFTELSSGRKNVLGRFGHESPTAGYMKHTPFLFLWSQWLFIVPHIQTHD